MASADEILGLTTAQPAQGTSAASAPTEESGQTTGPQPDLVGRVKAGILAPFGGGDLPRDPSGAPAGDARDPSFALQSLGAIGNVLMPGSWEEIAIQAAGGLPGRGMAPAAGRMGLQVAAPAGIAALKGEDPTMAGIQGGMAALTSGGLGGLAKSAVRAGARALSNDTANVATMAAVVAPNFRGASARETIGNILGGSGHAQAQRVMEQAETAALAALQGKMVNLPSLARLGIPGSAGKGIPLYRPDDALRHLKAMEKAAAGNPTTAVRDAALLAEARRELESFIPQAELQQLQLAREGYHRTQQVHRLFTGKGDTGRGDEIKPGDVEKLIPEGKKATRGEIDMATLQRNFQALEADMRKAFTPREMEMWRQVLRFEPLRRDVPGQGPGLNWWGPIPHPHRLPRLPTRTGGSGTLAEIAAQAGRQVGARLPHVADEMPAPVPTQEQRLGATIPGAEAISDFRRALNLTQGIESPPMGTRATAVPRPSITPRIPQ